MRNEERTTDLSAAGPLFFIVLSGLCLFLFYTNVARAANACVSTGTGNWSASGTWTSCGGVIPTAADSVTILTGHIITVDTAAVANTVTINVNAAAGGNGISINAGRSLTVTGAVTLNIPTAATTDLNVGAGALTAGSIAIPGSATANRFATVSVGTGTVTVLGSVTFSGSAPRARYTSTGASLTNIGGDFGSGGTLTTSGTGTFNFNGSVAQVIGAYATYNNFQINNTGSSVSFGGTTTIGGTLLVNTGTLDIGAMSPTVVGATTVNSTVRISSITGTKTFGDITIANGGSFTFTAAEGVTFTGNLTINGSGAMSGTTGTFVFQKVGGGTIGGTSTSTVTVADVNFNTNYSNSLPFTVSATTTVGAGVTITNTGTFTAIGALNGTTGTFTQGANGILNIGLTSNIATLNATAVPNEIHYIRTAGAQTIKSTTYHHLFIEEAGQTGTLGGAITVNGNLSVISGTLDDGGSQITGNATGNLTVASGAKLSLGSAAAATSFPTGFTTAHVTLDAASTVIYNSNLAQTISSISTYGNLTTAATAVVTKTAAGALTIGGTFTNGNNNNFTDGGFAITVKGGSVMTGTHTGTGKILFAGGSTVHAVSGTGSYNNVELNDANGVSQSGTTNIGGTFMVTSGSWTPNGNNLAVIGDTSVSGTIAITNTAGTKTFGNITINSGGSISFSAAEAVTVNGNLTVNGTGAITGTPGTWTFQKVGGGSISGTTPSLTISGGATFSTVYSILVPFTVNTMTVGAGVNETNTGTITVNTSLTGTGSFTQSPNTVLNLGGAVTISTLDASANPNEVHYTSTTGAQGVKAANYYNLFIDKAGQTATLPGGTTNVLGNLNVSAGILTLGSSNLNVNGTTDIFGTLDDVNNTGLASFGGLVTVHSGGSWTGNAGEACNFNFQNGFIFNGTTFTTGPGLYTFLTNNQNIGGSSPISVKNLVVTGIQLTNSSTAPLTVGTALSGTGELIQNPNTVLNIGGTSPIATLTATAAGNTVNYNGITAQTVHVGTYQTLNVSGNISGSVNITTDITANTALILGATMFSTGSSTMKIGPGATLTRTSGFINGNLQKNISTGFPSASFEIGSGPDYTPVQLSFHNVTTAGDVLVNTTSNDHPNIATSQIAASRSANRFYTVSSTGVGFDTYDGTFTFVPTDVDVGANPANFILEEFNTGAWTRPTLGTVTSTSVSVTGLTTFGDFQIGEPAINASKFIILDPGTSTVGIAKTVTIQAQDINSQPATTFIGSVTLVTGGTSVSGGGLVSLVNGVGTTTVTTNVAQTVTLTLADTQNTGLDVSSSRFITFSPGLDAAFNLNHPGLVSTGVRTAYVVGRTDQFANPTSVSSTVVYLYTSSTSTSAAFFDAPSGGNQISSTTIGAGSTSTQFWYFETVPGTYTITASDNPSAPDGAAGIADATDNLTVAPGAVKFIFANVPATATAGDTVTFNVLAVDSFNVIDTSFNQDVTVTKTGSASGAPTGGGLVTMINGVATGTVSDDLAEAVHLGLQDTQSTGLNVSSTASVAFVGGPAAELSLNHPGNMNTGTRLGYTLLRQDQLDNPTSVSSTVVYLYTSSTSTSAAFFDAPSGGNQISSTTIGAGSTSTQFWYFETVPGTYTITASDNPSAPDGAAGIADATDNLTVAPGAVKFIFANVPATATAGDTVTFNVLAVDSFGTIDPSFGRGVTVTKTGSGSVGGGGFIQLINGIATGTVTDIVAENLSLGLLDTQATGLGVTDVRTIQFFPGPVSPPASTSTPGPITSLLGGGGSVPLGVRPVINLTFSGWAFPAASISFVRKDLGLTQAPIVQAATTAADASFSIKLNNVTRLTGQTYLLVFADKSGVISETKAYNVPAGTENLVNSNLVIAPTVGFGGDSIVSRGSPVIVQGFGAPKATVTLLVDGVGIGTVTVNALSGEYRYVLDTSGLATGRHSLAATQVLNAIRSDSSSQQSFTVSPLQNAKLDLNGDGSVDVKDISIYLSYLKNLGAGVVSFNTTDPNLLRVLDLNGDGNLNVQDLSILLHAAGLQ